MEKVWPLAGSVAPAKGHAPLCLRMTAPIKRKEWALHEKSSVIGEHRVCVGAPKAIPTLCPSALTQSGLPQSTSRLHSHLCQYGTKMGVTALAGPMHGQQTERGISLYWPWMAKAARQSTTWWKALVGVRLYAPLWNGSHCCPLEFTLGSSTSNVKGS